MIEGLNLLDGAWYAGNAHAIWDELRREAPVLWDPVAQVWGIFSYQDVLAVEKNPRRSPATAHRGPTATTCR